MHARIVQIALATLLVGASTAWVQNAHSQEKKEEGKREAPQIDAATGKRLNEAIEAVNAEKYVEAKSALSKLNMEKLSPYEKSRVEQMYASIANSENDYNAAQQHLAAAIATGGMNDVEILNSQYQIAQLFMVQEKWKEGANALKQWFAIAPSPNSGAYYLLAIAYYRMDDHKGALEPAQKAVDMAEKPQANWIELLLALRLEDEQYDRAIPLLKALVSMAPDKRTNWIQLSAVYRQLERYDEALAVIELANLLGFITSESDIKSLADLEAYAGVPFRAAKLLETSIAKDKLTPDEKLWEKLSTAWIAARDYDKALVPLRKAAALHSNGDLYVRIAELQLRTEDWAAASEALRQAFAKGGLRDPGSSQLLMGIALFSQKQPKEALTWFQRAASNPKVATQAQGWIRHIQSQS